MHNISDIALAEKFIVHTPIIPTVDEGQNDKEMQLFYCMKQYIYIVHNSHKKHPQIVLSIWDPGFVFLHSTSNNILNNVGPPVVKSQEIM